MAGDLIRIKRPWRRTPQHGVTPSGAHAIMAVPARHTLPVRLFHWLGAGLVLLAYLTEEQAEGLRRAAAAVGPNLHVLAGVGLLLLALPRLLARRHEARRRRGPSAQIAAVALQAALLLFTVVQPVLGLLSVWAGGHGVDLAPLPWTLPPLLRLDGRGHLLGEIHETLGTVFYGVIGLHVLAAAFHQFVRRDGTLRRMV